MSTSYTLTTARAIAQVGQRIYQAPGLDATVDWSRNHSHVTVTWGRPRNRGQMPRLIRVRMALPIAVFDAAWTRVEQNALWTAVTGDERERPDRGTNIVWRTFLGDTGPVRHPNPEQYKTSLVADLREVTGRYPNDDELTAMVHDLRASSAEFDSIWGHAQVGHHGGEPKTIDHPMVGPIELDCDVLSIHGSDLKIIVLTAPPRSSASDALRLLSVIGTENLNTPAGERHPRIATE